MECFSAILLFDAFSARKMERFRHWIIVTSLAFLEATFLNIASKALPDYSKILIALVLYYFVHRILYISNRFFGLYISIIIYATMCCIDNLWHTLALLLSETLNAKLYKGRKQTVKRAADNKRRYAPGEGSIPPVLLSGVSKGGGPLWHTTLLAKCSVLYLLAWLTEETGCGASCTPFAPAGKQAEFLRMGMSKKSACFQRTAAGI